MLETLGIGKERLALLTRFVRDVFPKVERELDEWRQVIAAAPESELARQGEASIANKRFHCLGGGVYALANSDAPDLVPLIVALQTISDYLDNLCDRSGCLDAATFRQLHLAVTDALDLDAAPADYYRLFSWRQDNGYLEALVARCHQVLALLPSYRAVRPELLRLAALYCDLQTFKHTYLQQREGLLQEWFDSYTEKGRSDLYWWEFAAASGSTLALFALCAAAGSPGLTEREARQLSEAYFPWVCGLHILLDYFIDQEEDRQGGDLNFVSYYRDSHEVGERLALFFKHALEHVAGLPQGHFHQTAVEGLLAFYLSDAKVEAQGLESTAALIISAGGRETLSMYRACKLLRRLGKI
jgi:tetraprenyl-beta-curcumene synthase